MQDVIGPDDKGLFCLNNGNPVGRIHGGNRPPFGLCVGIYSYACVYEDYGKKYGHVCLIMSVSRPSGENEREKGEAQYQDGKGRARKDAECEFI